MKILLIEDEYKTGDYLKQGLTESGYLTDWTTDGVTGLHLAFSEQYDLIILDVMLPELDGWHIVDRIRKSGKNLPILFFSVHDKFHRTLILSGFCLLKIAKISLNSSFFPKPIKR
ncbi:response regulator [Acinetobacter haemolyticus]|nr:response regulator [Acinetobacter haemolyticus]